MSAASLVCLPVVFLGCAATTDSPVEGDDGEATAGDVALPSTESAPAPEPDPELGDSELGELSADDGLVLGDDPRLIPAPPEGFDATSSCSRVNGHCLTSRELRRIRYFADRVFPRMNGSRSSRLTRASRVAWWALKEGILSLDRPLRHSICGPNNTRLGPLQICASGVPWQVGITGVQVTYQDLGTVEDTSRALFPDLTIRQVLKKSAVEAGYSMDTSTGQAIRSSKGSLRKSWLLRMSPVGTTRQAPIVYGECVERSEPWCYGTAWPSTARYAPNRSAALRSIADIRALLAAMTE